MAGSKKNLNSGRRLFINRAVAATLIVIATLSIIVMRMVYLQVENHAHFQTLSIDNRIKLLPLPPTRGLIYDRNGVLLAENIPSAELLITPEKTNDVDALIEKLKPVIRISDEDIQRFQKLRKRKRRFEKIPIRSGLSEHEMARFAVKRFLFPGAELGISQQRHYPLGNLTAHVVGYIGRINEREAETIDDAEYAGSTHIGKTGLELFYEEALHGNVGVRKVEINAAGQVIRILETQPPTPGRDLQLYFDARLQEVAMEALGEHQGAVVAIDVRTGGILALASKPSFDANLFVNGISFKDYGELRDDPRRPLFNRVINGNYPPGSTVKPFIGLAGLELGVIGADQSISCHGKYNIKGTKRVFRDWKKSGHGKVDLDTAITQSCDVYFYDLAYSMGIDRFNEYLSQFRFGQRTGVDMPAETRAVLPSKAWKMGRFNQIWLPGDTVNAGIGQGYFQASPLQLAYATAVLASGGKLTPPRLAARVGRSSTLPMEENIGQIPKSHEKHWDHVLEGMAHVVEGTRGTAKRIRNDHYRIAGKTGTAQVITIKQTEEYDASKLSREKHDHALFVAYAPIEDPQIAISVIVENGGHGGATAAPVARKVMDHYFGIPDDTKPAEETGKAERVEQAATDGADPEHEGNQNE